MEMGSLNDAETAAVATANLKRYVSGTLTDQDLNAWVAGLRKYTLHIFWAVIRERDHVQRADAEGAEVFAHVPACADDPGDVVGAYLVIRFSEGGTRVIAVNKTIERDGPTPENK